VASIVVLVMIFTAIGIVGPLGFVLWLSRGIKRDDLNGHAAPDLNARIARRCSGLGVRGELTVSRSA
jgi:hypothetical protein